MPVYMGFLLIVHLVKARPQNIVASASSTMLSVRFHNQFSNSIDPKFNVPNII